MRELRIENPAGASVIAVGESIECLASYCGGTRSVVITDPQVHAALGRRFPSFPVIEIGLGEGSKSLRTIEEVYEAFLGLEIDRASVVIAVGGGVVCDVAGFAASTYLRGLRFGFVPTTLLAQVDASVGGKNGVNLRAYKNLVGTFAQPAFVLCDFDLLGTLPALELRNGVAEVVKTAAIGDSDLFSFLEQRWEGILCLEHGPVERMVYDSLKVKAGIVSRDEREAGERRKLNFGHTLGHAVEKVYHLRHGEAISIGMVAAARLSAARGLLPAAEADRLEGLLKRLGLPVRIEMDSALINDALRKDKKRQDREIHFVLLDGIGSAHVELIGIGELEEVIDDLRQSR